jgi:hypothetical protein
MGALASRPLTQTSATPPLNGVLVKNGLAEASRDDALVYYRRSFTSR